MKKILGISILLVLVFACEEQNHEYLTDSDSFKSEEIALYPLSEFDLTPSAFQLKSGKSVEKNFKIQKATGILKVVPYANCNDLLGLQGISEGNGNATHTGKFHVINTWCVPPEGTPAYITGIITAANGDVIYVMVINYYVENETTHFQYLITGGTGKFDGAKGSYELHGTVDWVNGIFDLNGEGVIVY